MIPNMELFDKIAKLELEKGIPYHISSSDGSAYSDALFLEMMGVVKTRYSYPDTYVSLTKDGRILSLARHILLPPTGNDPAGSNVLQGTMDFGETVSPTAPKGETK